MVRPLPSAAELVEQVCKQVVGWSSVRVRTEADLEKVLAADATEEEKTWANFDEEEAEVKLEVAEMLWDDLLVETGACLQALEEKLSRRASGAGGRLR